MRGKEFRTKLLQILMTVELGVNEIIMPLLQQVNLTLRQSYILFILAEKKDLTIGNLAQLLNMAQSNISAICKTLENNGLLERIRLKEDERIVRVRLTDQGRQLIEKLNSGFKCFDQLLDDFPQEKMDLALKGYIEFSELIAFLIQSKKSSQ